MAGAAPVITLLKAGGLWTKRVNSNTVVKEGVKFDGSTDRNDIENIPARIWQ